MNTKLLCRGIVSVDSAANSYRRRVADREHRAHVFRLICDRSDRGHRIGGDSYRSRARDGSAARDRETNVARDLKATRRRVDRVQVLAHAWPNRNVQDFYVFCHRFTAATNSPEE